MCTVWVSVPGIQGKALILILYEKVFVLQKYELKYLGYNVGNLLSSVSEKCTCAHKMCACKRQMMTINEAQVLTTGKSG